MQHIKISKNDMPQHISSAGKSDDMMQHIKISENDMPQHISGAEKSDDMLQHIKISKNDMPQHISAAQTSETRSATSSYVKNKYAALFCLAIWLACLAAAITISGSVDVSGIVAAPIETSSCLTFARIGTSVNAACNR